MSVQLIRLFFVTIAISCWYAAARISATSDTPDQWQQLADQDLDAATKRPRNVDKTAKNILVFIGDGMGLTTISASRIYGVGASGYLAFERFPYTAVIKTYSNDKMVPDSASTATAIFCGEKINQLTLGVRSDVSVGNCSWFERGRKDAGDVRLASVATWAQRAGKSTGFVTTTRVTHATPAALYAHTPHRQWECDANVPDTCAVKDIGRQLFEDEPGINFDVIMGGGRQCLQNLRTQSPPVALDNWACQRNDSLDLIAHWQRSNPEPSAVFVDTNAKLNAIDYAHTTKILGVFANSHMPMDHARDRGPNGAPSLTNMTMAALRVLRNNQNGFFLMVEGGLIDYAHHRGHARQALSETVQFSNTIRESVAYLEQIGLLDDTLIISTSDHSHALQFNGYPARKADILGVAGISKTDNRSYTVLTYATGGANNRAFDSTTGAHRFDPGTADTTAFNYSQQALVETSEAYHGGTDVLLYARGPMAHLFTSTHEQTYIAHAIAYAAKIGRFADTKSAAVAATSATYLLLPFGLLLLTSLYF